MRPVFFGHRRSLRQNFKNCLQLVYDFGLVLVPFKIFLELGGKFKNFHNDSTKLRKLSRSSVSRLSDVSASFIAARVFLFGLSDTNAIRTLSTRLFKLRLCRLASACNLVRSSSLSRKDVCFRIEVAGFIVKIISNAKVIHLYNICKSAIVNSTDQQIVSIRYFI